MSLDNKWLKRAGMGLNALIGALMIFAGSGKAFGVAPKEIVEKMNAIGLGDKLALIGFGEMIAAVLMVLPVTAPLGILLTSGFWGGVICIHMAHHEDYVFPSVLLALTWVGGYLRGSIPLFATESGVVGKPQA